MNASSDRRDGDSVPELLRRFAPALLAVPLAASIGLNVLLWRYARKYFIQTQDVRTDFKGLFHYPDPPPPPRAGVPRVVIFGDSRAHMWITDGLPASLEYVNRGIGAQTTHQVLARIEPHLLELAPEIVVLQVGVNELKDLPLFPERRDWIVASCLENIAAIVDGAIGAGAHVVLTTVFPHGPIELQRRPFWSPAIDEAIVEVNAQLPSLAVGRCRLFDAYALLERDGVVDRRWQTDALHISEDGYRRLNRELAPLLEEIVAERRRTRTAARAAAAQSIR